MADLIPVESPTRVTSTYLGAALKRRLYPTVFCYHGCVARFSEGLTFRERIGDLRSHILIMKRAGYEFILPSQYQAWLNGDVEYDHPVTTLHFDDGLLSTELIIPWLISQGIPCGLALITRKQRKYDPDQDFLSWRQISQWVSSGLVELLFHTHNLHHLTLVRKDGVVDVAPVLEGPCWIDDGDVVYRDAGDSRWYWDFSLLDDIALAIPIWGTDPYDGTKLIETTLNILPKATGTVAHLRFWMALSRPYGSGYPAQVEIRANGSLVWSGTVAPKQYSTRAQWVEREFYSITLDTPFAITTGVALALEFKTLNQGKGVAMLYAIPTTDDSNFYCVTNCEGLYEAGTQGPPERFWQYIDYPAGDRYPTKPSIILAFATGADATEMQYTTYVEQDLDKFQEVVTEWLHATWQKVEVWTAPVMYFWAPYYVLVDEPIAGAPPYINGVPVGWDNPNRVEAVLPIVSPTTINVDALSLEIGRAENFEDGDANPYRTGWPPTLASVNFINSAEQRSYTATFRFYIGNTSTGPWTPIALGQIYPLVRKTSVDCTQFTLTANVTRYLRVEPINGGPTVGDEQKCRWPLLKVFCLTRTGNSAADAVEQVIYPFGSYYAEGNGPIQQPGFKDINPALKALLISKGYAQGYTIQAYRNTPAAEFREPDLRHTEWALGRWIVYGDQAPQASSNNLAAISGFLLRDVQHQGVKFQVSLEADPLGNATIRQKWKVLDYVAFDAYGFDGAGGIEPAPINDGGTYDLVTYADDKSWLQARGVKCLLIINNNLGTGEPDSVIGSHVVNNPAIYVPLIVDLCVDDGWDGITCNLEAVPSADRAAATDFYQQLARAMHDANKILHATVPAITGTTYDADFWTGWCDLLEIVKVVDAVKVMSYTETGPGTDPGPAAPQYFWDAVYAYIKGVVPEPYWRRVLCGCRAFGHMWDSGAATTDYITYHRGIAEGLNYAKRLDVRDTEIGWGAGNVRAWFGTPETVIRSVEEAVRSNFGGIGLWKLDDGDIEEFFPNSIQIGRVTNMSFLDVRFPETISFGSAGGPSFNTGMATAQSGHEDRNSRWSMPLHKYDATMAVRNQTEWEAIRNLFMISRGKANSFRYRDWADYQIINQFIGTSDGVRTTFQIYKEYVFGAYSLIRLIYLPVDGTIHVYRNGVELVSGWTINLLTGLISFGVPPAAGTITVTCEFDVHARFDIDYLPAEILAASDNETNYSPGSIAIVEVRELP